MVKRWIYAEWSRSRAFQPQFRRREVVGSWLSGLLAISALGGISAWSHYGLVVAPSAPPRCCPSAIPTVPWPSPATLFWATPWRRSSAGSKAMSGPIPIIGSESVSPLVAMSLFAALVIVHALAATVWTGGHLVLDLGVLPKALRARDASIIRAFEETFEPLGFGALVIQVLSGLGLVGILLPGYRGLFDPANPIGLLAGVKLLLLAATLALALHARLRLIPHLSDDTLAPLAWHIRGITALAVAFVVVGAGLRLGGFG